MRATDLDHLKRGTAVLVACLAHALNESDPAFQARFLDRIGEAYADLKQNVHGNAQHELELLSWTAELLTGSDSLERRAKPS